MSTREHGRYMALYHAILEVVVSFYENFEMEATCQMAVNPDTHEVIAVESESEVPNGWIYETVSDLTPRDIDNVAEKYFDLR